MHTWIPLISHLFPGITLLNAWQLTLEGWSIYLNAAADMKRQSEDGGEHG